MQTQQVGVGHARDVIADHAVNWFDLQAFLVSGRYPLRMLKQKVEKLVHLFDGGAAGLRSGRHGSILAPLTMLSSGG